MKRLKIIYRRESGFVFRRYVHYNYLSTRGQSVQPIGNIKIGLCPEFTAYIKVVLAEVNKRTGLSVDIPVGTPAPCIMENYTNRSATPVT